MRVLYTTSNSNLGSTTSSINAIIQELIPRGLSPVVLFQEPGPWQQEIAARGIPCYFHPLRSPGWERPLGSIRDLWRLTRLVRREKIDLIHCNEHNHYPLVRRVARSAGVPIVVSLHWNLEPSFSHWAFRPPF